MGTSVNGNEFLAKMEAFSAKVQSVDAAAVKAASQIVKDTILAVATPATGGDLRLSGTARNGRQPRRVGVSYKVNGDTSLVGASGPMHWLEDGVAQHPIIPGAGKLVKGLSGSALAGAEGPALSAGSVAGLAKGKRAGGRMYWQGPDGLLSGYVVDQGGGLKPKHVWTEGVETARPLAFAEFVKAQNTALLESFR